MGSGALGRTEGWRKSVSPSGPSTLFSALTLVPLGGACPLVLLPLPLRLFPFLITLCESLDDTWFKWEVFAFRAPRASLSA